MEGIIFYGMLVEFCAESLVWVSERGLLMVRVTEFSARPTWRSRPFVVLAYVVTNFLLAILSEECHTCCEVRN